MSASNDYVVIGLGKFGQAVVRKLEELGKVCLAIDANEDRVQEVANIASEVLILDSTKREALEDIGIHNIKNIIIAVGSDLAASLTTAANILSLHKEYNKDEDINIVAKASNINHKFLLESIGITNIISPETEAGEKAAYRAVWKLGLDLTTVDEQHSIANVVVKNPKLTNKKLQVLRIPDNYKINLIAIKRNNKVIIPRGDERLNLNDEILFISDNNNIAKVYNDFSLAYPTRAKEQLHLIKKKKKSSKKQGFFNKTKKK